MKTELNEKQQELLALDDTEKVNVYLQTFAWADFYNHVDVLENGKIKLMCDAFERPRYYTQKGILKEFNKCIKEAVWVGELLETLEDRQSGELVNKYI